MQSFNVCIKIVFATQLFLCFLLLSVTNLFPLNSYENYEAQKTFINLNAALHVNKEETLRSFVLLKVY